MALQTKISNNFDHTLRDQLDENFEELDKARINIDGKEWPTVSDRLDAIEKALKFMGMPIDGSDYY